MNMTQFLLNSKPYIISYIAIASVSLISACVCGNQISTIGFCLTSSQHTMVAVFEGI